MRVERQFSVFLENKPGRLLQICSALAKEKVSLDALAVVDSRDHSVLRFVVDKPEAAQAALEKLGVPFQESDVCVVEIKNQVGSMASMCERLASEKINIDYLYSSSGSRNGKTIVILKATPVEKVRQVLAEGAPIKPTRAPLRRAPVRKAP